MKVKVNNLEETKKLANIFVDFIKPNLCLLLEGELAAGKTTFTKFLLEGLGVNEAVASPSFIIMNQYQTKDELKINHMDCYRLLTLDNEEEWEMYLEHFLDSANIIEWPNIITKYLSSQYDVIKILINVNNENERVFNIKTKNEELLSRLGKEG